MGQALVQTLCARQAPFIKTSPIIYFTSHFILLYNLASTASVVRFGREFDSGKTS